ncbi:MAG TPA: glycosyltransferase [Candidatus Thermoplasmatota archaeon]|nr:glycosyltransferase [Candidatus Thermoplasmatota archaeon]
MPQPQVSVIVPVYNDVARLELLMDALAAQTYPRGLMQVLIIDNASEEDVQGAVRRRGAPFVALHEARPGSYAARNRGLQSATGAVLAFTDGDCIPAPTWLERGVAALAEWPEAGLVAGRIELFARPGRRPSSVELWEVAYGFPQQRFVEVQHFGATANVFTRREVMEAVGPFNAALKSGGDKEWGQRVHAAGYPVVYAPGVVVRHPARRTFREIGGKVRRVTGGMADLRGGGPPLTWRGVPGHVAHYTRKVVRDLGSHRKQAGTRRAAFRLGAVQWYFEYVRMRELLRLRGGKSSRR